jgi:hypothetical protein
VAWRRWSPAQAMGEVRPRATTCLVGKLPKAARQEPTNRGRSRRPSVRGVENLLPANLTSTDTTVRDAGMLLFLHPRPRSSHCRSSRLLEPSSSAAGAGPRPRPGCPWPETRRHARPGPARRHGEERRLLPRDRQGASGGANEVGPFWIRLPSGLGSGAGLVGWSACGWGRACQHRPARSLHPGRGGSTRLPPRGRSPARPR